MEMRAFEYAPPNDALSVIYSDDDLIIVDKPSGLLSVPGKTETDCLESRVKAAYPDALTVHRLDMATSGLMIFARNSAAQRHIGLQFEKRYVDKTYAARVQGYVLGESGHINLPLICDWPNRPRQMVCFETGKAAQTDWEIVTREKNATRLALYPKTGRSHQLRVHMLAIGHAILGDRIYADDAGFTVAPRLQLHARTLTLRKPTGGDWVTFKSQTPF